MPKRSCSRQEIEDEQEKAPKPKIVYIKPIRYTSRQLRRESI